MGSKHLEPEEAKGDAEADAQELAEREKHEVEVAN